MTPDSASSSRGSTEAEQPFALSLVRGDPLLRAQQAIGLVPAQGLGVARRAVILAAVTWLPIAAWALVTGHLRPAPNGEALLQHFGVQVRCLVAIPLFVLAEGAAHGITRRLLPQFVASRLIPLERREAFRDVLRDVARLRDAWLPWVLIAGVLAAWLWLNPARTPHEVSWTGGVPPGGSGLGGWWFLYVVRPIYLGLVLAWLWRLALACVLLVRVTRLGLALVPTHPDRAGGLGFLEELPRAFAAVVLGLSAVVSSHWAHDVLYHEATLSALRFQMAGFVVLILLLFLAPLFALAPPLLLARRRALLDYGALVAEHGRQVGRRWIEHESLADDALLSAPELGPVADTAALYESVRRMRPLPISRVSVTALAVPALLPILVVLSLQVPLRDILLRILKALA